MPECGLLALAKEIGWFDFFHQSFGIEHSIISKEHSQNSYSYCFLHKICARFLKNEINFFLKQLKSSLEDKTIKFRKKSVNNLYEIFYLESRKLRTLIKTNKNLLKKFTIEKVANNVISKMQHKTFLYNKQNFFCEEQKKLCEELIKKDLHNEGVVKKEEDVGIAFTDDKVTIETENGFATYKLPHLII